MSFRLITLRIGKLVQVICSGRLLGVLLRNCVLAAVEHMPVLSSELRTVVDIGANRGQFALSVREWAPKAFIISFEPLAGPAAVFRRIFSDDENIVLYQAAIGECSESRAMHVSQRDDSSSLLPISSIQTTLFPGTQEVATIEIDVGRLEDFISGDELQAPAMLKLDVQGFEYEALMGCESLLRHFSYVYCECSFVELYTGQRLAGEVIDWLSVRGFRLVGVYNPHYDRLGKAVQADFLFSQHRKN